MAARRNKNQARRNGAGNGTPGWMWLLIGAVLAALAFLVVPGLLKKDGFDPLKPVPNPDAQPPAQIAEADTDVATDAPVAAESAPKPTQYEFYDLLPGKEVQMSDAELAASAREEQAREQRLQQQARAQPEAQAANDATAAVNATPSPAAPKPLDEAATATQTPSPIAEKPAATVASAAPAASSARYILQAGSFGASGDAESTKAKIALLGLGARVESAQINGKTVYRVRMGPYGSASELAEAKRKLASGGLPAMAIRAQ